MYHLIRQKGRLLLLLLVITIIITMGGCDTNNQQTENNTPGKDIKDTELKKPVYIGAYYVKDTPDRSYLVREEHTIPQTDNLLKASVEELVNVKPRTEGAYNILPPDTRVLDVTTENTTAIVNFSEEVLNANAGSASEVMGIQCIVNTLTEFPDIETVSFQVEGSTEGRVMDWWGHVGLYDQPFKRDVSTVFEPAIWVTHPQPNQVAGVPMLVKGSALVSDGNISIQLVDDQENILAQMHGEATKSAPERGSFEMSITFDPPGKGKGFLQVLGKKPEDGSELEKVSVPVNWP